MSHHGVVVERWVKVPSDAIQAILQVEDEEQGVGLVETFKRHGLGDVLAHVVKISRQGTYNLQGKC